jgi:glycosyltransferase involved in cell wall biosynthesis
MSRIHFAYPSMRKGRPSTLPSNFNQYVEIDSTRRDSTHGAAIESYVRSHKIDVLFGFDQPASLPSYIHFRRGGIKQFISYWGAPMSSISNPLKLGLKRLEVMLLRNGPNRYIFESKGMQETATRGRGIASSKTHVVHLSVDTAQFYPASEDYSYVYETFAIPLQRKIFLYSGHMEQRKGVWVIMDAANHLAAHRAESDWHILLLGNQTGEEQWLLDRLSPQAKSHVTFGGYRDDINRLHRGCYSGIIASTGWDSLTCSALEMQASGLPLIASDLPGLNEAAPPELTHLLFKPGDCAQLANLMDTLLDAPHEQQKASAIALDRIQKQFTIPQQIENLVAACTLENVHMRRP